MQRVRIPNGIASLTFSSTCAWSFVFRPNSFPTHLTILSSFDHFVLFWPIFRTQACSPQLTCVFSFGKFRSASPVRSRRLTEQGRPVQHCTCFGTELGKFLKLRHNLIISTARSSVAHQIRRSIHPIHPTPLLYHGATSVFDV